MIVLSYFYDLSPFLRKSNPPGRVRLILSLSLSVRVRSRMPCLRASERVSAMRLELWDSSLRDPSRPIEITLNLCLYGPVSVCLCSPLILLPAGPLNEHERGRPFNIERPSGCTPSSISGAKSGYRGGWIYVRSRDRLRDDGAHWIRKDSLSSTDLAVIIFSLLQKKSK